MSFDYICEMKKEAQGTGSMFVDVLPSGGEMCAYIIQRNLIIIFFLTSLFLKPCVPIQL